MLAGGLSKLTPDLTMLRTLNGFLFEPVTSHFARCAGKTSENRPRKNKPTVKTMPGEEQPDETPQRRKRCGDKKQPLNHPQDRLNRASNQIHDAGENPGTRCESESNGTDDESEHDNDKRRYESSNATVSPQSIVMITSYLSLASFVFPDSLLGHV